MNNKKQEENLNIETIANNIFNEIYENAHQAKNCIKCNSDNISIINNENALYKCHNCNYTFSPKVNSLYNKVKLTNEKWVKLLISMISDYTLEETVRFVQSNAESIKRKWALIFNEIDWNKYNLLVRETPTKNIYADFDIILN